MTTSYGNLTVQGIQLALTGKTTIAATIAMTNQSVIEPIPSGTSTIAVPAAQNGVIYQPGTTASTTCTWGSTSGLQNAINPTSLSVWTFDSGHYPTNIVIVTGAGGAYLQFF